MKTHPTLTIYEELAAFSASQNAKLQTEVNQLRQEKQDISDYGYILNVARTWKDAKQREDSLQAQLAEAKKEAKSWESHWKMYRDAWVRELGGWTIPKAHEIDSLVLTTRKRCVNPLLGNCSTPHWLGKPTEDRSALQQTAHPRDSSCREWIADNSEPNPRAEALEAQLAQMREVAAEILAHHVVFCSMKEAAVYAQSQIKLEDALSSTASASSWLAEHDRKAKSEALREAADHVRLTGSGCSCEVWLRARAAELEAEEKP